MADLTGIGSIISGVGGIGTSIANSITNAEINKKNYELQKDWQNYQKLPIISSTYPYSST